MASHEFAHPATGDQVPHVLPLRAYLGVWGSLMGLTAITVAVSYFDFGTWNLLVSLLVASIKASLVAAIFMHLWFDKRFNAIVFLISAVFLVILIAFTMFDTRYRGMAEEVEQERVPDISQPFAKPAASPTAPAPAAPASPTPSH
jgi:cytochrome c oxidase subunit IV